MEIITFIQKDSVGFSFGWQSANWPWNFSVLCLELRQTRWTHWALRSILITQRETVRSVTVEELRKLLRHWLEKAPLHLVVSCWTILSEFQTLPNSHITRKFDSGSQFMSGSSSRHGTIFLFTKYPVMQPLTKVPCSHSHTRPMDGTLLSIQNGDCTSLFCCKQIFLDQLLCFLIAFKL